MLATRFPEARVQLTREAQSSCDTSRCNGNEVVEITMCQKWQALRCGSGYHKVPHYQYSLFRAKMKQGDSPDARMD